MQIEHRYYTQTKMKIHGLVYPAGRLIPIEIAESLPHMDTEIKMHRVRREVIPVSDNGGVSMGTVEVQERPSTKKTGKKTGKRRGRPRKTKP